MEVQPCITPTGRAFGRAANGAGDAISGPANDASDPAKNPSYSAVRIITSTIVASASQFCAVQWHSCRRSC